MPIRVLDDNGEGYADDTIKAIDRAIDQGVARDQPQPRRLPPAPVDALRRPRLQGRARARRGRRRSSWSSPRATTACRSARTRRSTASSASARSTARATRSVFSSFGSNVDLMAPGGSGLGGSAEDVLSTYTTAATSRSPGTSQAAPHVAGVAALLVSLGLAGQEAADADRRDRRRRGGLGRRHVRRRHRGCAAAVAGLGVPAPTDPGDPDAATRQLLHEAAR